MPFCHLTLKCERPLSPAYPRQIETWGDHLRKRRLDLKLFQKDVAERLGVSEATVWNWERNRYSPRFRYFPKIVEFLGYSPECSTTLTLAQRIVASRKRLGRSQKELAHVLGVNQSTLARWEQGKRVPEGAYLEKVNAFLSRWFIPERDQ